MKALPDANPDQDEAGAKARAATDGPAGTGTVRRRKGAGTPPPDAVGTTGQAIATTTGAGGQDEACPAGTTGLAEDCPAAPAADAVRRRDGVLTALEECIAAMLLKGAANLEEDLNMHVKTLDERKVRQRATMFVVERGAAKPKQRIDLNHNVSGGLEHRHSLCPRSEELLAALTGAGDDQ